MRKRLTKHLKSEYWPQKPVGFASSETHVIVRQIRIGLCPMLLFFVFTLITSGLFAQYAAEDYDWVKTWILPPDAVSEAELMLEDGRLLQAGEPFSGLVYQLYEDGSLWEASRYRDGKKNGLSLLWYPEGQPQMSAGYRDGALHGRFQAWYPSGSMIYDMYINRGSYASDLLLDRDQGRLREEQEISEREGNTDDGNRD